jgi:glutamate formiminotransferase / formiminotetrahydrofolate cyclodeaminase
MGVALEKYNITQVSMNLTNYNVTPIHTAYEEVKKKLKGWVLRFQGVKL